MLQSLKLSKNRGASPPEPTRDNTFYQYFLWFNLIFNTPVKLVSTFCRLSTLSTVDFVDYEILEVLEGLEGLDYLEGLVD